MVIQTYKGKLVQIDWCTMKVFHSGMEVLSTTKKNPYKKLNVMTSFFPFRNGKTPTLLMRIIKAKSNEKKK